MALARPDSRVCARGRARDAERGSVASINVVIDNGSVVRLIRSARSKALLTGLRPGGMHVCEDVADCYQLESGACLELLHELRCFRQVA